MTTILLFRFSNYLHTKFHHASQSTNMKNKLIPFHIYNISKDSLKTVLLYVLDSKLKQKHFFTQQLLFSFGIVFITLRLAAPLTRRVWKLIMHGTHVQVPAGRIFKLFAAHGTLVRGGTCVYLKNIFKLFNRR